jgi:DNA-binding transcriptional ArsR family regulator
MNQLERGTMIVDPSADDRLDRAFMALADPVRRGIIARLSRGPATVNELAEPFQITKQAVSKHIQVLEQAGLVTRNAGLCTSLPHNSKHSPRGSIATG